MTKDTVIQAIESYSNDGYIQIPQGYHTSLAVQVNDLEELIGASLQIVTSLAENKKLKLLPEAVLSNIKNYIEASRRDSENINSIDINLAESTLLSMRNQIEQIIALSSPFLTLVENMNYKQLVKEVDSLMADIKDSVKKQRKAFNNLKTETENNNEKSTKLLESVSSGRLSENFKKLGSSKWNFWLMFGSSSLAVTSMIILILVSSELNALLIEAFVSGNLDYRIFLAKWSSMLPYIFILSVSLLELRNRIRQKDTYAYRESVAGSLDGYSQSLFNRADDLHNPSERDQVRVMVIQFMIDSMLELTKSPNNKPEKQSIGLKVKDIGEANITT